MIKEEFYLPNASGAHRLHCICWKSESEVVGVLQIVHGMVEFIDRYHDFADYLTKQGIAVIGHDHVGHGKTAKTPAELGHFHQTDGKRQLILDIHQMAREAKRRFPRVPHFILGHSMGSFFTRKYITIFANHIDGAILMGCGDISPFLADMGKTLARCLIRIKGHRHKAPLLEHLTFLGYQKKIPNPRTHRDWISRDEKVVEAYLAHPHCTFTFTAGAFLDFYSIIAYDAKKIRFHHIPRNLPILFASGDADPVGNWGKGPKNLYDMYQRRGFSDVSLHLYPAFRHEILNESGREAVYENLANWILQRLDKT